MAASPGVSVSVQIDSETGGAYIRLSQAPVSRTVEASTYVRVDLDEFDVVRGIELLDLEQPLDLVDLAQRFHINSLTIDAIMGAIAWRGSPGTSRAPQATGRDGGPPVYIEMPLCD